MSPSTSANDGPRMSGGGRGRGGGGRGRGRGGRAGGSGGGGRGRGGRGGRGGSGRGNGSNSNHHKRSFAPSSSSESYSSPGKRSHRNDNEAGGGDDTNANATDNDAAMPDAEPAKATSGAQQKLAHMTNQRFADLPISNASRRALAEIFQYEYMTTVQAETLPLILHKDNQDILAKAKTGTGKTLAFMIPTIEKIIHMSSSSSSSNHNHKKTNNNNNNNLETPAAAAAAPIHCLVISPTRELAQQIATETSKLLTYHEPKYRKVVICVGGTNKNADLRAFQQSNNNNYNSNSSIAVLVATPGRLLDHLQTTPGFAVRISSSLSTLILDEADQLLDMGFRPDIERILSLLKPSQQSKPPCHHHHRQTLLFSATIPPSVNEIASLALRSNYNFVDTVGEDAEQTHMHVQQQLMITTQEQLIHSLFAILERETTNSNNGYKIIVFFTTARLTGFMAELFNSVSGQTGYHVLEIVSVISPLISLIVGPLSFFIPHPHCCIFVSPRITASFNSIYLALSEVPKRTRTSLGTIP